LPDVFTYSENNFRRIQFNADAGTVSIYNYDYDSREFDERYVSDV